MSMNGYKCNNLLTGITLVILLGSSINSPTLASVNRFESFSIGVPQWTLIDNFEKLDSIKHWVKIDPDNNTEPFIANPQVTEIRKNSDNGNAYLIKKPAADGIVGNRKALSYKRLPLPVKTGEVFTFFTRINVEAFPNNHSFGLSNLSSEEIAQHNYNAFEPMIRITDKPESDGTKNDGTLMVLTGKKRYSKIINPKTGKPAKPLTTDKWYELWYVVDNRSLKNGGQQYDLYVKGGEFTQQTKVFSHARFRMQRDAPLIYFLAISNTGSKKKPYGNGGVRYDDIYMSKGAVLITPPDI